MEENHIIVGLKQHKLTSINEVVNHYKKQIISFCYSYTCDYHEAEDLSQEVFISLIKSINDFREECSLKTYLYRIAVSKCLDYKRKKSIKSFLNGLFNYHPKACRDFTEESIREYVLAMPTKLKIPVLLYYYSGLSQEEIATVLNISRRSVEGRIYRAKQKLRLELEQGGFVLCKNNGISLTELSQLQD